MLENYTKTDDGVITATFNFQMLNLENRWQLIKAVFFGNKIDIVYKPASIKEPEKEVGEV